MWPDRVLNPGPLTFESGALPTALHGPADCSREGHIKKEDRNKNGRYTFPKSMSIHLKIIAEWMESHGLVTFLI